VKRESKCRNCSHRRRALTFTWRHPEVPAFSPAGRGISHLPRHADDAEIAFDRAFERDPRRSVAFDKLFRAVRARNEDDRLLGIIEKRLDVSEDDIACLSDGDGRFTAAESAALSFATALAADHLSIGAHEIASLREHFTEDEAVELGMFAAVMVGSGRLAYAFRAFGS